MKKLPEITATFWVMKICATTLGETAGDLLSLTLKLGYKFSTVILVLFFLITLTAQLFSKRYIPVIYWWLSFQPVLQELPCPISWTEHLV
jgi:uncharacterized membrane-anchored protein